MYALILRTITKTGKIIEIPIVTSRDLSFLGELLDDEDFYSSYFSGDKQFSIYSATLH